MSQPMLDMAHRRVHEAALRNIELRLGKLEALPLAAQEVDLALALLLLHHLTDVAGVLRAVARALRHGGRLLLVEVHPHDNERFRARMADRRRGIDPDQMRAWLTDAGLEPVHRWDFDHVEHPEHELAPLPRLYGLIAAKADGARPDSNPSQPKTPTAR